MPPAAKTCLWIPAALALAAPGGVWADVVHLKNGGQVEGRVLDDDRSPPGPYVVETASGGRITLERSQVDRIDRQSELDEQYQQRARAAPDTVEAHWRLAQWCRKNILRDAYERHLERIVELNPQHAEARRLLGYRQVQGRWLTRDELMAARGMVLHRGRYRTRQEIDLLDRFEERDATAGEWRARLARWRRQLFDRQPERVVEARKNITSIRDPDAAESLVDLLNKEEVFEVKLMLLEVLAQIEHQAALDALVEHALYDAHDEIRAQSLEYLVKSGRPGIAAPFIRALRSRDNSTVNRAAHALREIGNPTAISPLIDALVTEHKIVYGNGSGPQQRYTMDSSGTFSFGGGGPRIEKRKLKNPAVLSALVVLTGGQSFDYDQPRWRAWLAAQKKIQQFDMRRDE